jgi:hypothetical protein
MTPPPNDSTLARSRREALIIMAAYAVAMTWTAVVCYVLGYERDPAEITRPFGLGIPDWVLWGIFAPWMACNLFTAWFTLCYMEDEQLADEDAEILAPEGDANLPDHGPTEDGHV